MSNKVELLGYYGSDKVIALSAWTSTDRDLPEEKKMRIPKMIRSLWMDGHETPFEKGMVHFLVDVEIATHIQLLKHRISSANFESARYKEIKEDKVFIPEDWKDLPVINSVYHGNQLFALGEKSEESEYEFDGEYDTWDKILEAYNELGNQLYHASLEDLTPILGRKRAKESCRFFKTYSSQLEGDISFNMRSFANFLKLRNDEHSQKEIRELAAEMLRLVQEIPGNPFEHTLNAIQERIERYKNN